MAASARLGKGQVMALAVSGDGLQIAVGSSIGVCVYSAKTFSETWCAESPGPILQLAFNPAGDRLLARTRDGILSEWEVAGGRQTPRISPGVNGVRSFTWAPDGQRIAVAGEAGDLALIDAQTLASTPITEDQVNLPVILAWAPDGKRIALANIQGAVGIYDLASNKTTLLPQPTAYGNPYPTTRLAWSPDSGMLILGSGTQAAAPGQASGEIRFWDTRSGAFVRQISIQNPVINLQLSPDGSRLAALQAGGTVALWDPQGGQQLDLTSGFQVGNPALAWTGDGQRLLLVDSSGQVATWGIAASSVSRAIDGYTSPVVDLAWSPDGKTIAASYLSGQLVLWDASTHHEARAWKGDPTQALRLAWDPQPGVQLLAVGGENVVLWNMATGNPVRQIASDLPRVGVLAWSSKGWQVAAGGVTGIVYVWEANTGQILQRIDVGHEVVGVGWSPDEQTLAAAWSEGGTGGIELYDGASGKHLASLNSGANIGELAWSRDGTKLAALAGGWVSVWDADTHHLLFNLGAGHSTGVESFAWAPDSQRMATAGGEIFVWDVGARQKVKTFEGYTGDVVALSFSPDGKDLASGSSDGTVLVWNLTR
jgi:WD40 repeat protein